MPEKPYDDSALFLLLVIGVIVLLVCLSQIDKF